MNAFTMECVACICARVCLCVVCMVCVGMCVCVCVDVCCVCVVCVWVCVFFNFELKIFRHTLPKIRLKSENERLMHITVTYMKARPSKAG